MPFIDLNTNNFQRGFLDTTQGGYEDPTYLGFRLVFNFNPTTRNPATLYTDDALFADPSSNLDSAQRYLQAIGYPVRAQMLKQFQEQLEFINTNTPWFFQSIEGLAEFWRIPWGREGWNNFRGKDKKITITCLESIDLRMTALADLYRKATFDPQTMRSLLPDNLRWFTFKIWLTEIRNFQRVMQAVTPGVPSGNTGNGEAGAPGFAQFEDVTGLISLMEFECSKCEFDFNDAFPVDDPMTNMMGQPQMARSKFSIEVHHIKETHTYTLQDLIISEGPNEQSMQVNGGYFQSGNVQNTTGNSSIQKQMPTYEGAVFPQTTQTSLNAKIDKIMANNAANDAQQIINTALSRITPTTLGNVFTNQPLAEALATFGAPINALINTPPNPPSVPDLGNALD